MMPLLLRLRRRVPWAEGPSQPPRPGSVRRRRNAAANRARVPGTRLSTRDLIDEALAGLLQRPGRSALTALGTVLGVWAFVAVLGLTATVSGQVSRRFTVLSATEVTIEAAPTDDATADDAFPPDAESRLTALNGTVAAGLMWTVEDGGGSLVSALPPASMRSRSAGERLEVRALSPGALRAVHPVMSQGRTYDRFHSDRAERVAVLGATAARRLGISRLDTQPAIFIGNVDLTVIGIVDDVDRHADILLTVMVPTTTAANLWGRPQSPVTMIVETRLGAAQLIGRQAAPALRPEAPERFKVVVPPDPRQLRDGVTNDLNVVFLLLAAVLLIVGAVGIANTTLVAVLERVPEIGLRRAMGARPQHVAAQFLTESSVLGTLGGLTGSALGVGTVLAVALSRNWTALIEPWTAIPAPLIGTVTGLLAGLYPALRAASIEPVEALQRQ